MPQFTIHEANHSLGSYTPPLSNILGSTPPTARARSAVAALFETSEGLAAAFDAVNKLSDPSLSAEGLAETRLARQKLLAAALEQRIREFSEPLDEAQVEAEKAAEPFWPRLNIDDVAQGNRVTSAWQVTISPQLEAGKSWDEIIGTLDHDGLLAVQRFAPAHEAAKRNKFQQGEVPSALRGIELTSQKRVVATAPEGTARDAMQQLIDVRAQHEVGSVAINALSNIARSAAAGDNHRLRQDLVPTSIAIKRAAHSVGANPAAMAANASGQAA